MKVLAILLATLAVAASYPVVETWSLMELSVAIQLKTHPQMMPYLKHALNTVMLAIFTGKTPDTVKVTVPAMDISMWTVEDLNEALENSNTRPELLPYLKKAHEELAEGGFAKKKIGIVTPVGLIPHRPPKGYKRVAKKTKSGI